MGERCQVPGVNDVMTTQTPAALRERADEVTKLVEAATPGPWSVDESCHPDIVEVGDGVVTGPVGARDARLVAAAPTHARELAATLRELADAREEVETLTVERDALRATVDRLRPVVGIVDDWWHLLPDEVQDRIERVITSSKCPNPRFIKQTLRALLATPDAVADERPRPVLPEVPDAD